MPIANGKTSTKSFLEYEKSKYRDVLADPGEAKGQIARALFINGAVSYYHFFTYHFPGLLFLSFVKGERVPLVVARDFPAAAESLLYKLLPTMAGGREVDVVRVVNGIHDVEDVIYTLAPERFLAGLLGRQLILPFVLHNAGIANPLRDLGGLKLFVRREGDSTGRKLVNQPEVEAWFVARGYVPVNPGTLPMEEQVILFSRATHIAGVEGGALTNLLFAANADYIVMLARPATEKDLFFQPLVRGTKTVFHTVYGEICGPGPVSRASDYILPIAKLDALDLYVAK